MFKSTIWFDMDGTLSDTYRVKNWADYLDGNTVDGMRSTYPFIVAEPKINPDIFSDIVERLSRYYNIGIISWLPMNATHNFKIQSIDAKQFWLKENFPRVYWDKILLIPYGTEKHKYKTSELDIIFDDNAKVRSGWGQLAKDEKDMFDKLIQLLITNEFGG